MDMSLALIMLTVKTFSKDWFSSSTVFTRIDNDSWVSKSKDVNVFKLLPSITKLLLLVSPSPLTNSNIWLSEGKSKSIEVNWPIIKPLALSSFSLIELFDKIISVGLLSLTGLMEMLTVPISLVKF